MEINFRENSADLVKTIDRAGLMAGSFREISMRTRDDIVDIFDQITVFDKGFCGPRDIGLLEDIGTEQSRIHLSGDADKRNRIGICCSDPGDQIGRARA